MSTNRAMMPAAVLTPATHVDVPLRGPVSVAAAVSRGQSGVVYQNPAPNATQPFVPSVAMQVEVRSS